MSITIKSPRIIEKNIIMTMEREIMKISLCMIVKDEEVFLEECLRLVSPFVNEIIIVDTGSCDATKVIANKYTDKLYDWKFENDFSAARNYSLRYATGDWILSLDADERLAYEQFKVLRMELEELKNERIMALNIKKYNFFKNGGWYISNAVKVFRNNKFIRYEGEVNESPKASIKRNGGEIVDSLAYINHIGYIRNANSRREKNKKYISIFERKLSADSQNLGTLAYLAVLHRAEGEFAIAKELCDRGDTIEESSISAHFQVLSGHVYKGMGMFEEAEIRYQKAHTLVGNDASIISNCGCISMCRGEFKKAVKILNEGIKKFPREYYLYVNLGLAYQFLGMYEKALECFEVAECGNPFLACECFDAKLEQDAFYIYYLETIPHYAGLNYHKAICKMQLMNKLSVHQL